jgi:hypothetical protein
MDIERYKQRLLELERKLSFQVGMSSRTRARRGTISRGTATGRWW